MAVKTGNSEKINPTKKRTSIGCSTLTSFRSKNDKRNKKRYRGQGR